jgi:hypothetical protein
METRQPAEELDNTDATTRKRYYSGRALTPNTNAKARNDLVPYRLTGAVQVEAWTYLLGLIRQGPT